VHELAKYSAVGSDAPNVSAYTSSRRVSVNLKNTSGVPAVPHGAARSAVAPAVVAAMSECIGPTLIVVALAQ